MILKKKYVILLTGCINPKGMIFTQLCNPSLRSKQYKDAIEWYQKHTNFLIVFCENSNTYLYDNNYISSRVELLSFDGNQEKEKGKGYGEMEIIAHALKHSRLLDKETIIIKITGRLIIKNIKALTVIHSILNLKNKLLCSMHSDFMFADSRVFITNRNIMENLCKHIEDIDDKKGRFFEHILAEVTNSLQVYFPFFIQPEIIGTSGTNGENYVAAKKTLLDQFKYLRYQLFLLKKWRKFITVR